MLPDDNQLSILRQILGRFVSLPYAIWSLAIPHIRANSYPSGEHILQAGEPINDLCFMIKGTARHYFLNARGREFNKAFICAGHPLSNIPTLLRGIPSPGYIQAIKPCVCLSIPYSDFLRLAEHHQEWGTIRTGLLEQALISKEQRLTDLLVLNASERYVRLLTDSPELVDSIPNYHIASYLGITDVALSRIRKRMGLTGSPQRCT